MHGCPSTLTSSRPEFSASFLIFGLNSRPKYLYRGGVLACLSAPGVVRRWDPVREHLDPVELRVRLTTRDGASVSLHEDHEGLWVREDGHAAAMSHGPVALPDFQGRRYTDLLRAVHHELLLHVVDGAPVRHFLSGAGPRLADAAIMCMALSYTGNLHLVRGWIDGLREPFDRHPDGRQEPDNLGQALYLASLVGGANHPLAKAALRELPRFRTRKHIAGLTDGQPHPVYQTKWVKFGLRALGLPDPYQVPRVPDSYARVFWVDFRDPNEPPAPAPPEMAAPATGSTGEPGPTGNPGAASPPSSAIDCARAHGTGRPVEQWLADRPRPWTYPLTHCPSAGADALGALRAACPEIEWPTPCAPCGRLAAETLLYLLDSR